MGANAKRSSAALEAAVHVVTFFLAMVVHELALEAASKAFPGLDALASAVTLFQFGFCFGMPIFLSRGASLATFPKDLSGCLPYIKLSLLVVGATALSTRSIVYVSYPTKVVFKSAKLIPTMIVSTLLNPPGKGGGGGVGGGGGGGGAGYGAMDYLAAALLSGGAAGYAYGGGGSGGSGGSGTGGGSHEYFGVALLLVSMACDALVPNLQQKLMAPPAGGELVPGSSSSSGSSSSGGGGGLGLSASALMVNVNGVGFAGLLAYMLLSGSLFSTVGTAAAHPALLGYLLTIGVGLSTAVLAYTKLIKSSGSVVAVAVSTLRKVATVVLSYVVFPKPILRIHIASGFVVLCGIILSTYSKQTADRAKRRQIGSGDGSGGGAAGAAS